jgi:hypothetical protein
MNTAVRSEDWQLFLAASTILTCEVQLRFNTGAGIEAILPSCNEAIGFLKSFEKP